MNRKQFIELTNITVGCTVSYKDDNRVENVPGVVIGMREDELIVKWDKSILWPGGAVEHYTYEAAKKLLQFLKGPSYTWLNLATIAPMTTENAARCFLLGALAYQSASDHRKVPDSIVELVLKTACSHDEAVKLFRDLYNFSHRSVGLE